MIEIPLILIVLFVIVISAGFFSLWLIGAIARAIVRPFLPRKAKPVAQFGNMQTCGNQSCRTDNPSHARFCRRCGYSLPMLLKLRSDSAAA